MEIQARDEQVQQTFIRLVSSFFCKGSPDFISIQIVRGTNSFVGLVYAVTAVESGKVNNQP